jgi:hypothetical protein
LIAKDFHLQTQHLQVNCAATICEVRHAVVGGDLAIRLYFEPETFRHAMTTYQVSIQAGIGANDVESARQQETRYRIEERFGDFQNSDGLTLPFHYELRFTKELQNGFTKLLEWDVAVTRVLNNVSLDPRNFQIK